MAGTPTRYQTSGLLPAARLWSKTSARGAEYLAGRLGGVRVTIMPKRDGEDGDHTHTLFFSEPQAKREGGG